MDPQQMPTIPASAYRERWASVQRMMAQQGLDLVVAYADDRATFGAAHALSLIHISEPTRLDARSRMPSSA